MNNEIELAKAELLRAKERIAKSLKTTPADKQNWAPSPTARTAIQLVAHAAMGTRGIGGMIAGKPFPFKNMEEMDAASRQSEKEYTTQEQALRLLEETTNEYISWLDTLTAEKLQSIVKFPFMDIPMTIAITIPADHLRGHAAQIDYLQTIIGDLTYHM